MCRSVVQCDPARGLAAFVPLLVDTLAARMRERPAAGDSQDTADTKLDEELQFNLQLLGEVLSCTNIGVFRSRGEHILPWVDRSAHTQALLYRPGQIHTAPQGPCRGPSPDSDFHCVHQQMDED